ncbi:hypothetical protein [Tenacibaculum sp. 190524A02b]|uniref:hypothetical protein n=1 Tax=Tenacibaculum vairaonense TaxID=3137860 RepID=UPI0031FA53B3
MKKLVIVFVSITTMLLFNSCTDNTLEKIEKNELQNKTKSLIDPSEDPAIDDEGEDEY